MKNANQFIQLTLSSDTIKVTLINDLLGKYDIPFAQIVTQHVAIHVENWSTEVFEYFVILLHNINESKDDREV